MNTNKKYIAFLFAAFAAASLTGTEANQQKSTLKLESFEFLGCGGSRSADEESDSVRRLISRNKVTYLVRHTATCGLDGRNPKVTFISDKLDLAYELYSPNDTIVYCDCDYWAKFTFGSSALQIRGVTFVGRELELLGGWPSGL